ncbi:MAG: LysR family transcriptional regulator [Rhodobacterales bacterium]|nr:LysR family transcriptional regulator [Rhodobacterales bacterium]
MNFRQLEAYRAVMVQGSVTGAAATLRVSQPGVSRLIADLERSLGFRLFERRKGRLHPTPEGLSFYGELERSFIGMEKLREAAREIADQRRGHLRIASMPAVSLDLLPGVVKRYMDDHAGLKVTLDVHTSPRIVEWVAAQHFDLGVAQLTLEQPGVDILHSYATNCVCVAAPGHRIAGLETVRPADLKGEPYVALSHHTLAALHIDQAFIEANVGRLILAETQPSYSACAMAARGIGVALVDSLTARFFGPERLTIRPFAPAVPFGFRIIRPSHAIVSRVMETFVETAHALITAHPGVYEVD